MSEEFIKILDNLTIAGCSARGSLPDLLPDQSGILRLPYIEEVICHLKLLRAFQALKDEVVNEKSIDVDRSWNEFLVNASRRFIAFVCSLKLRIKTQENHKILVSLSYLPPLDVCLVWYSILMSPGDFYDTFKRLSERFMKVPFPLTAIAEAIDNKNFVYQPSFARIQQYLDLVSLYTYNEPINDVYFLSKPNISLSVSIRCPLCDEILVENVKLFTDSDSGFLDNGFTIKKSESSECTCKIGSTITHSELVKQKFLRDLQSGHLCGLFKAILKTNYQPVDIVSVEEQLCQKISDNIQGIDIEELSFAELRDVLNRECMKYVVMNTLKKKAHHKENFEDLISVIMDTYSEMRLIYLTMPKSSVDDSFYIDFLDHVLAQSNFLRKTNQLDWLHSPFVKEILRESCRRYSNWLKLGTSCQKLADTTLGSRDRKILVPTLDIDLIWRSHNLAFYSYLSGTIEGSGTLIDVIEKPEQAELDITFTETGLRYKQKYNEEYSICFCNLCVSVRSKVIPKYESWAEGNKSSTIVINDPPEYPKQDSPPDYGNSTKLDLPPGYGKSSDESSDSGTKYQTEYTETDSEYREDLSHKDQPEILPDYRSRSQVTTSLAFPPEYLNVAESDGPPDYDKELRQQELPPNYTAVPLFAISESYPYYCANESGVPKMSDSIIIGGCSCRGDRGCGGGKSVRYGKLKTFDSIQLP
jgi:hypothetical protein